MIPSPDHQNVPLMRRFTSAQWGVLCVAFAALLGLLPHWSGVGVVWSLVLLLGGWVVWRRESGFAFVQTTFVASPRFVPVYALVVVAQAWQMLQIGLVSFFWTSGAVLLVVGVLRNPSVGENNTFPVHFDGRVGLLRGYGQYIAAGTGLCFLSLLMTWGQSPGFFSFGWSGGMQMVSDYNYYTHSIGSHMEYNPIMNMNNWYYPGFALSGRSRPYALWAEFALLGLLVWAAYKRNTVLSLRDKRIGWGLAAFLLFWWLNAAKGLGQAAFVGPLLFFVGTALVFVGVSFLARGQTEGRWDFTHLLGGLLSRHAGKQTRQAGKQK